MSGVGCAKCVRLPQVPMNRRPVCAAANQAQCLASSVATGTALTTPYVVSANAWASDNALAYDFGVQHPDGTQCAARFGMTPPRSAPMLSPDAGTPSAFFWEVFDELLRLNVELGYEVEEQSDDPRAMLQSDQLVPAEPAACAPENPHSANLLRARQGRVRDELRLSLVHVLQPACGRPGEPVHDGALRLRARQLRRLQLHHHQRHGARSAQAPGTSCACRSKRVNLPRHSVFTQRQSLCWTHHPTRMQPNSL